MAAMPQWSTLELYPQEFVASQYYSMKVSPSRTIHAAQPWHCVVSSEGTSLAKRAYNGDTALRSRRRAIVGLDTRFGHVTLYYTSNICEAPLEAMARVQCGLATQTLKLIHPKTVEIWRKRTKSPNYVLLCSFIGARSSLCPWVILINATQVTTQD